MERCAGFRIADGTVTPGIRREAFRGLGGREYVKRLRVKSLVEMFYEVVFGNSFQDRDFSIDS